MRAERKSQLLGDAHVSSTPKLNSNQGKKISLGSYAK